jgi:thiol-disulfide isomerase/thioredoxin
MKKAFSSLPSMLVSPILLAMVFSFSVTAQSGEQEISLEDKVDDQVILPQNLLDQKGQKVSADVLEGKFIGLYFSASWCGPCRAFTPSLIKFRDAHKDTFEVILVGADGSPKAQANYMRKYKMPWLAMKNQSPEAIKISKSLGVPHIPYLVILDSDGKIVSKNGEKEVSRLGKNAFAPWKKLTK